MPKPARFLVVLFVLAAWPPALGVHDSDSSVPSKRVAAQSVYPIAVFYRKQLSRSSARFSFAKVGRLEGHATLSLGHRPAYDQATIRLSPDAGTLYALMSLQL